MWQWHTIILAILLKSQVQLSSPVLDTKSVVYLFSIPMDHGFSNVTELRAIAHAATKFMCAQFVKLCHLELQGCCLNTFSRHHTLATHALTHHY